MQGELAGRPCWPERPPSFLHVPWPAASFFSRSRSPWALPGNRSSFSTRSFGGFQFLFRVPLATLRQFFIPVPFPGRPSGHRHVQFGTPFLTESFTLARFYKGLASKGGRNRGPAGRPGLRPKQREKKLGRGRPKEREKKLGGPFGEPRPRQFFFLAVPQFLFPVPGEAAPGLPRPLQFFF